ncbi:MAG: transcription antitermination factor NusB [Alphaproteobacteria bacterium]|nr:transcription antitermination factor NusB [Alphaproteobacteria bacterium]|tara:strand:- start:66 stop:521 length:456 start_codon:yes stop_codon:yes gene_type:complete
MKNNLLSKSFTRYAAIQALYNLNFSNNLNDIKNYLTTNKVFFIDSNLDLNFKKTKMNKVFFCKILDLIDKDKDKIDEFIKLNLSKGWSLERLPKVQLAILRVAIAEMMIYPRTSIAIIISEYIMFTESFFTEKECSFTNAILEKIYKKINA